MHTRQKSSDHPVATIGIDVGKTTFHLVGLDKRGAIVLRTKVSRSQLAPREQLARVDATLPCNLRHRVAGTACLLDKLKLLLRAPPPSALRPRDDLYPPAHRPCA